MKGKGGGAGTPHMVAYPTSTTLRNEAIPLMEFLSTNLGVAVNHTITSGPPSIKIKSLPAPT